MDLRAAVDNLIVERARDEKKSDYADSLKALESLLLESQYGDEITIASIEVLGSNSEECTKQLNRLMHYGVHLISKAEGVDATLLKETIRRFQKGEIELAEALRITGLSKSTLYRRIREM